MPVYLFKCKKKHTFEEFQSFADYDAKVSVNCVQCGKPANYMISPRGYIGGTSSFNMEKDEVTQLGKKFKNAKEMDRYLKDNNLEPCSIDSVKPRETPIQKIHNSQQYKEAEKGFINAINAAKMGGVDPEVTRITGISDDNSH